jgi:hypothetical protein
MIAVLGALLLGLIGMLLVGFNYAANMTTWGIFGAGQFPLWAGVLCIVGALVLGLGKTFKVF